MPDKEVKNIRDLIFYQYAKIIAKSALGPEAKKTGTGKELNVVDLDFEI